MHVPCIWFYIYNCLISLAFCGHRNYQHNFLIVIFLKVLFGLSERSMMTHFLSVSAVPSFLSYTGYWDMSQISHLHHCAYSTLHVDWGYLKIFTGNDPLLIPSQSYINGCQPNPLHDFTSPQPCHVQIMASYLDLFMPLQPYLKPNGIAANSDNLHDCANLLY